MMRFVLLALVLAFVPQARASKPPAAPDAVYEIQALGSIRIGENGMVIDHTLDAALSPRVSDVLANHIRSWQFEPILIDGKPASAQTKMRVVLTATPHGGESYALTISDVWFGVPGSSDQTVPPRYPTGALKAGIGAKVVVVARVNAEGQVTDAYAHQTNLSHRAKDRVAQNWREQFERASLKSARRWRFEPGSMINGKPVESTIALSVTYAVVSGAPKKDSRAYIPGPVNPSPWPGFEVVAKLDGLVGDDFYPLDSPFRLQQPVIGTVL